MYIASYLEELKRYQKKYSCEFLKNKTLCLSGGTGLIGSFFVDLILTQNINCKIILLVRNELKAKKRFEKFNYDSRLIFKECDLTKEINIDGNVDYVLHLASLTDPYNYANHPIEIMMTNFLGTKNLLDLAKNKKAKFFLSSSNEVYGISDKKLLKEDDYGYINILDPRSCYNESKKAAETLCSCYKKEFNLDIVIARFSRVYGPTMKLEDTKVLSQFIVKVLNNEDIVLKSDGKQLFNYTYVGDIAIAMLILLEQNHNSLTYNVNNSDLIALKDIASFLANLSSKKVIFEIPDAQEKAGYSRALVSSLNPEKFESEFKFKLDTLLFDGLKRTLFILKEIMANKN